MFELFTENFEELKEKEYALVDFWQTTCPECMALKPKIEELEEKFPHIVFYSVNCQKERKLAIALKIFGLPSVLLFSNGNVVSKLQKENCNIDNIKQALNEKKY